MIFMRKICFALITLSIVCFFTSCSNEEDVNGGYSEEEKVKIETLMNLFESYGWELDTTVSVEQRNKELLEMDYEKTKSFLEYMDNGIEFVLVKSPSLYPHWYEEWDQQIVDYAKKYGLDYFNYEKLADEIGIDYSTDTYDAGLHLNLSGAEKLSKYFGEYLTETYDLTDYREDPEYEQVYEEKIQFYENMKEAQYEELEKYGEIISY